MLSMILLNKHQMWIWCLSHRRSTAQHQQSLCFYVPQYSVLKIQMQIGRSCKKTTRLALNIPEPLQLVPSDASFSGKEKWIP